MAKLDTKPRCKTCFSIILSDNPDSCVWDYQTSRFLFCGERCLNAFLERRENIFLPTNVSKVEPEDLEMRPVENRWEILDFGEEL